VPDDTPYYRLDDASEYVSTVEINGETFVRVEKEALEILSATAIGDIAHLLRPGHLQQLSNILSGTFNCPFCQYIL